MSATEIVTRVGSEPRLLAAWRYRMPALFCALILLLVALASHPVAEIGMDDDWSYLQTARAFAQTGHFVYNGWAEPIQGWQTVLGALFARLFGFSLTAIRASTLAVAMATALLMHRTLIRAGILPRNATIGTLALILSPLFLPLAVSFMTDIGCLFSITLCLYLCLRALQANNECVAINWLGLAAFSNVVGGTGRQVAWLGVLVIMPSSLWLLRRNRRILIAGLTFLAISSVLIACVMGWYRRQPYSITEPLLPDTVFHKSFFDVLPFFFAVTFCSATFLLPILIAFVPVVSRRYRRGKDFALLVAMICVTGILFAQHGSLSFASFRAPYPGPYVTDRGMVAGVLLQGSRPVVLSNGVRTIITLAIDLATYCFVAFAYSSRPSSQAVALNNNISTRALLILLAPFSICYFMLVIPRAFEYGLPDRYVLPLLLFGTILLLRFFQERVQADLPFTSILLTILFAAFAMAGTHDAFSLYRAREAAFQELRARGIPAVSIDGGLEQNVLTEVDLIGHVNDPRIRVPASYHFINSPAVPSDCSPMDYWFFPAVRPEYALSFDPNACGGPAGFAPVYYHNWLSPHTGAIYIVASRRKVSPVP